MQKNFINLPRADAPVFANANSISEIKNAIEGMVESVEAIKSDFDGRLAGLEREILDGKAVATVGGFSSLECGEREAFANFGRTGIRGAMHTGSNPDGGYLVPRTVETAISRLARDATTMRSISQVVTTETSTYVKVVSLNGPTANWVSEKEGRNQTQGMHLSELTFPAEELTAMPAVTQTLLDDAFTDVATELSNEITTVFSELENVAFVTGDGVKKPKGFLDYPKVANASWTWGKLGYVKSGVAANIFDNNNNGVDALYGLYFGLNATYRANASWLMNSATALVVSKLKNAEGNYLWQPSTQLGAPALLLGRPVVIEESMPAIEANAFPVAFGDFERGYLIVDRVGIRMLRDPFSSKPYVLFYTTKRVGGGVQDFKAIKLLKCEA